VRYGGGTIRRFENHFYDLEVMCRERAVAAAKELEYWLAEAEEWARVMTEANL
jgi:hypothetical protein